MESSNFEISTDSFNSLILPKHFPGTERDTFLLSIDYKHAKGESWHTTVKTDSDYWLSNSMQGNIERNLSPFTKYLDISRVFECTHFSVLYNYPKGNAICYLKKYQCLKEHPTLTLDAFGSCDIDDTVIYDTTIFEIFDVSKYAWFIDGNKGFDQFIDSAMIYPQEALDACINGYVPLEFVVETDGTISNIRTIGKKIGFGIEEKALRLINLTDGLWYPAFIKERKVRMRIRFHWVR